MERPAHAPVDDRPPRSDDRPWHILAGVEAARALRTDPDRGLEETEARERRTRYGPNTLPEGERRSLIRLFVQQYRSLIIGILAVAAVLAWVIGEVVDAAVIAVVLLANGALGFLQEYRAERSLDALRRMLVPTATVRRSGRQQTVESAALVPGDVVALDTGDRVPADGRLLAASSLQVDESVLTGESTPVEKTAEPLDAVDLPLAERRCMAYTNTIVTRGRGRLLVTATGAATEMGSLATALQTAEGRETPLARQLDRLGRRLSAVAGVAVVVVVTLGLLRGEPLGALALTGVALAVAAIPEGLPAVVTVTLALGLAAMSRRGAIVKRLPSAETLGSTTVICTDKTGTLTLNQMTARALVTGGRRYDVTGAGYGADGRVEADGAPVDDDLAAVLAPLVLCNDSDLHGDELVGDPTEGGLLALAVKAGLDLAAVRAGAPRVAELPFDSAAKFMATAHRTEGGVWLYVKGAPDVLLARSTRILGDGGTQRLGEDDRDDLAAQIEGLSGEGLRALAVARRRLRDDDLHGDADLAALVDELELLGVVGLLDPPRTEARDAVQTCHRAGIDVKMITGDHAGTATAIGDALGIRGQAVTGRQLDAMSDDELRGRLDALAVFARVAPEHKVRILRALADHGHVTAMTGDGVNDAPALRNADIGVAMGQGGTEVAQEAADMILTDDNFATIVAAVEEGRRIFDDIVAFVRFQLSTNIGAIVTLVTAPLLALPLPFTPIQILFVNLLADGPPAMALGVDPARPGAMERPPLQPGTPILGGRRLLRLLWFGALMAVGTLGLYAWGLGHGDADEARTLAFVTFVLYQCANALNARTAERSIFGPHLLTNRWLWLALAGVVGLLVAVVHVPWAQSILATTTIPAAWWAAAAGVASTVVWLEEARKIAAARLGRRGRRG